MRIKEWTILRRLWRGIRPFKWPRRDRTAFEEDRRTIFRWRCSGSGPSTGHRRKGSQSSLRIGYYDGLFGSTFRQGSLPRSRTTNASRSTDHILWSAWSGSVTSVQRFHSPGALQNCAIWKASCESCSLLVSEKMYYSYEHSSEKKLVYGKVSNPLKWKSIYHNSILSLSLFLLRELPLLIILQKRIVHFTFPQFSIFNFKHRDAITRFSKQFAYSFHSPSIKVILLEFYYHPCLFTQITSIIILPPKISISQNLLLRNIYQKKNIPLHYLKFQVYPSPP